MTRRDEIRLRTYADRYAKTCQDLRLLEAFHSGRELLKQDLVMALKRIVPLSQTAEQELKAMREWLQGRARPVSDENLAVAEPSKRRRSIER